VPLLHWAILQRTFAVSGRLTALVDRFRHGTPDAHEPALSEAELIAAIRAETSAAFGEEAVEPANALVERGATIPDPATAAPAQATLPSADPSSVHVLFFVGLTLGGFVAAATGGAFVAVPMLRGELFPRLLGHSPASAVVVLFLGGTLVGFGTRMASGCTSGHGLCGVSQLQKGSLLATVAFFGMGVVTSFVLAALS
jgi:hypothetical protein